jgi:uncharacterized zinc-type alcohol dehydrogenase-like protein
MVRHWVRLCIAIATLLQYQRNLTRTTRLISFAALASLVCVNAEMTPVDTLCMACEDETCDFKPTRMQRRPLGDFDVLIQMAYCGVCHSDLHAAAGHTKDLFTPPQYPFVPGHELAGVVAEVGHRVTTFSVGDHCGVGCMVDSCMECDRCLVGEEQLCKQQVQTYGAYDVSSRAAQVPAGRQTLGGYTSVMVVHERFAIRIPKSYPLELAGPVMCAGTTVYDPLQKYGAGAGTRVAVIGLGGLGVFGVKMAKALGCVVTVVSRSMSKQPMAKELGADGYVASSDARQMAAARGSFDLILNFVPSQHDYVPYVRLLDRGGKLVFLGVHAAWAACMWRGGEVSGPCRGSFIGGLRTTQEAIDLCDRERIFPQVTVRPVSALNEIYEALDASNEAATRFVLDLRASLTEEAFTACTAPPPKLKPAEAGLNKLAVAKEILFMKFRLRGPKPKYVSVS